MGTVDTSRDTDFPFVALVRKFSYTGRSVRLTFERKARCGVKESRIWQWILGTVADTVYGMIVDQNRTKIKFT